MSKWALKRMEHSLTTQKFWEGFWKIGSKEPSISVINDLPFAKLLHSYIPFSHGKALEVGCFPGSILAYICKNFGYDPTGIDFVKGGKEVFGEVMKVNSILNYEFYDHDFLQWKTTKQYQLVCSFGFIEHFKNPEEIIKKHIDLLEKGGTLLVSVPNFNGLRYFIADYTDGETLEKHNMEVMNLDFYRKIAEKYGLHIKYLGYYGRFEYTWANYNPSFLQKLIYYPFKILSKLTFGYPFKSRFLSGWIFFIAQRP